MERDARFQNHILHLSQSPQYTRFNKISPPSQSPQSSSPLSMVSQWGPYGERCCVSRAKGLFIHSFISLKESPIKELSSKIGEHMVTVHGAHTDKRHMYNGVRPGSPKGSFTSLLLATPVSCSFPHNTSHLGFSIPEPCYPACAVVTLYR